MGGAQEGRAGVEAELLMALNQLAPVPAAWEEGEAQRGWGLEDPCPESDADTDSQDRQDKGTWREQRMNGSPSVR